MSLQSVQEDANKILQTAQAMQGAYTQSIKDVLKDWGHPVWGAQSFFCEYISSGKHNHCFKIMHKEERAAPLIMRFPVSASELGDVSIVSKSADLAFDETIYEEQLQLANLGMAPKLYYYCPKKNALIAQFIEGQSLSASDFAQDSLCERVFDKLGWVHLQNCKVSHHTRGTWRKSIFLGRALEYLTDFAAASKDYSGEIYSKALYRKYISVVKHIAVVLKKTDPFLKVPVHNDLIPANILKTNKGDLHFIDWDNVKMGDPDEDVANLIWSAELPPEQWSIAIGAYFTSQGGRLCDNTALRQDRILAYLPLIAFYRAQKYLKHYNNLDALDLQRAFEKMAKSMQDCHQYLAVKAVQQAVDRLAETSGKGGHA